MAGKTLIKPSYHCAASTLSLTIVHAMGLNSSGKNLIVFRQHAGADTSFFQWHRRAGWIRSAVSPLSCVLSVSRKIVPPSRKLSMAKCGIVSQQQIVMAKW